MQVARSRGRGATSGPVRDGFGMAPRLRFFALLALLAPLFWGLQLMVREQAPRVEVRLVYPESSLEMVAAPAQAERVVERIVYVPVASSDRAPSAAEATGAARQPEVASVAPAAAQPGDAASVAAGVQDDASAVAADAGGSPAEPPGLTGLVTLAPVPAPVQVNAAPPAPVVAAAAPPARASEAPIVAVAPADDTEDGDAPVEAVEEQDDSMATFDEVAEAAPAPEDDDGERRFVQVIETTIEADQSTHVAYYLVPARRAEAEVSDVESPQVFLDADDDRVADAADEVEAGNDEVAASDEVVESDEVAESDDVVMYAGDDGAAGEADEPEAADDGSDADEAADSSPVQVVTVLASTSEGTSFEVESGQ
jgi:hypothetical protein